MITCCTRRKRGNTTTLASVAAAIAASYPPVNAGDEPIVIEYPDKFTGIAKHSHGSCELPNEDVDRISERPVFAGATLDMIMADVAKAESDLASVLQNNDASPREVESAKELYALRKETIMGKLKKLVADAYILGWTSHDNQMAKKNMTLSGRLLTQIADFAFIIVRITLVYICVNWTIAAMTFVFKWVEDRFLNSN